MPISEKARAKINLAIDVLGARPDGYHQVDMVMGTLELADTLALTPSPAGQKVPKLSLQGAADAVRALEGEAPGDNLVVRAMGHFWERFFPPEERPVYDCHLVKEIPVAAGLGGGSSDAAAVLRGLARYYRIKDATALREVAAQLGSDVPFFLRGGLARATGRGELLEPLTVNWTTEVILVKPNFPLATAAVYRHLQVDQLQHRPHLPRLLQGLALADEAMIAASAANVLETPAFQLHPELRDVKEGMQRAGAWLAMMSGSGPTMFGFFTPDKVNYALEFLQGLFPEYRVIHTRFDWRQEKLD